MTSFFDGIYGSELDGRLTDKGELVAHILEAEQIRAASALMVGDRCHDIIGAQKNRVRSAAVSMGYGTAAEIEAAGPDLICDSLSELAAFLAP